MSCKKFSTSRKHSHSIGNNYWSPHLANYKGKPACYYMRAFTLLELIITLAIGSILLTSAIPSFHHYTQRSYADSIISDLQNSVYAARQLAITQKKIITLCPIGVQRCGGDWKEGYMLFSDANNNGIIDDNDALINVNATALSQFTLHWRASGGRNYLRYSPTGMARQFGRFHLCSIDGEIGHARALTINRQGRLRAYRDRDHDGIVEDIDGRLPYCS